MEARITEKIGIVDIIRDFSSKLMPVYSNVKVEFVEDGLVLTAVNPDGFATAKLDAQVDGHGSFLIQADLIPYMFTQDARLIVQDGRVHVQTNKTSYKFPFSSIGDFPQVKLETGFPIEFNYKELYELLLKVILFAGKNSAFQSMNGILFEFSGTKLRLVATDGFRLALIETEKSGEGMYLIPVKMIGKIMAILKNRMNSAKHEPTVKVTFSASQNIFEFGDLVIAAKNITAQFPPYQKVLGHPRTTTVVLKKDELVNVLRDYLKLFQNGIIFDIHDGQLDVIGQSDIAESVSSIGIEMQGNPIRIKFNPRYLIDVFGNIQSENVTLYFGQSNTPMYVEEGEYKCVIMPMTL